MRRIGFGRGAAALVAGALAAAVLALSACGEDESTASSPREAVPAGVVVYADVVVRPEGDQREALDAILERFGSFDVGELVISQLEQSAAEDGVDFDYERDVASWLGERAGIFFTDPENDVGAVVLESTDDEAAQQAVDRLLAEEEDLADAEYEGHEYVTTGDDDGAIAVTDGLVIAGSVGGIEAAFDTIDGGDSLVDDSAFTGELSTDELDESFASLYVDVAAAIESSGGVDPEDQQIFDAFAPGLTEHPVVATTALTDDTVAIDVSYGSLGAFGAFGYTGGNSDLLRELPSDAWAATAAADVGAAYTELLDQVRSGEFPLPPGSEDQLELFEGQVQQETGASLDELLGGFGDLGLFARGGGPGDLDGAMVIETSDADAMSKLIDFAGRTFESQGGRVRPAEVAGASGISITTPDAPREILFVTDADRAVVAYGADAAEAALQPAETIGATEEFAGAEEDFGDEVPLGTYVEIAPAIDALARVGGVDEFQLGIVRPYLERLGFLAAGSTDDGETATSRIVLGFN